MAACGAPCIRCSLHPVLPASGAPCIRCSLHPVLPASGAPCIRCSLHPVLPASGGTCIRCSLHPVLPASGAPCIRCSLHPVLPASGAPCIRWSLHPVLHASGAPCIRCSLHPVLPASGAPCIRSGVDFISLFKRAWTNANKTISSPRWLKNNWHTKKIFTGMSVVWSITFGTCLAESCFRMLACTCLTRSGVRLQLGAILRKRTTRSSIPSRLFCPTHRLSWISLKLSTEVEMILFKISISTVNNWKFNCKCVLNGHLTTSYRYIVLRQFDPDFNLDQ